MVINDSAPRSSRALNMSNATVAAANSAAANTDAKTTDAATANAKPANNFPPPKTDKPRPHVCTTCQRSFARLEHLKRHERSHTKEKPFECPECARCFARRDLLLRHQQKLHQTSTPSSRPRNRRESASGVTPAQARRKSSIVGASPVVGANASGNASMRPRANTISHVDINAMQMIASATASAARGPGGHNRHPSLSGLPANAMHGLGLSLMNQRGLSQTLGKLDTATLANGEFDAGLRTAPALSAFTPDFDFENFVFGSGSTINPNALHYSDAAHSVGLDQRSPFPGTLNDISSTQTFEDNFDWVTGFENQINIRSNENVIDGSSPSAISTTSQSGMSDVMVDGSNQPLPASTSSMWQPSVMGPPQLTNPFAMDLNGSVFPDLLNGAPVSPQPASQKINDPYLSASHNSMRSLSPSEVKTRGALHPLGLHAVPDIQPTLPPGNNGASPVTTVTEATRTAIVNTLSHRQNFGGRKRTLATSPSAQGQLGMGAAFNLPSIQDLQRYVASYLSYFHPHFPFLHLPTLSFDMSAAPTDEDGAIGGRGCLLLAISMIGALYAGDASQSKDLFEMSKKMIFLFLEERRKAEMDRHADAKARRSASAGADHSSMPSDDGADTPVWLVQAMLLNVSYGHNVIDKIATSIASTHCIALVSLAQAAGLGKQTPLSTPSADIVMSDDPNVNWSKHAELLEHQQWIEWSRMEERKRTMYAVFILSSLLVTAYNHAPPLTNSEISLDLPCDEEFFSAESSTAFFAKGGIEAAAHNTVPFSEALAELLHAGERQKQQQGDSQNAQASNLKTSSVGCLLLIYALHNYIWETRQRHQNEVWTTEETEKMHRHIEPALRAWQILWANNPQHSVAQPIGIGLGPASSDAIPLLDLAYVRLFIELAGAKERFWDRDWEGMAAEIAKGSQLLPVGGRSPGSNDGTENTDGTDTSVHGSVFSASPANQSTTTDGSMNKAPLSGALTESEKLASRREKHLRKASFFAADSLAMSESLGFAMSTTHGPELALPAALCIFECAQVLIEWVATVQDRVGAYIGIMGRDEIDFGSMPAIMVLEDDDVKLLEKVQNMIAAAESKIKLQLTMDGNDQDFVLDNAGGFCSKLLQLVGMMFDKAGVWQVYNLMSQCALAQVSACTARAERSVAARG